MNPLKVEESETVQEKEVVELIDCGQASERTKGGFYGVESEAGFPPFNRFL